MIKNKSVNIVTILIPKNRKRVLTVLGGIAGFWSMVFLNPDFARAKFGFTGEVAWAYSKKMTSEPSLSDTQLLDDITQSPFGGFKKIKRLVVKKGNKPGIVYQLSRPDVVAYIYERSLQGREVTVLHEELKKPHLAKVISAVILLLDAGIDISRLELTVNEDEVSLGIDDKKLIVLTATKDIQNPPEIPTIMLIESEISNILFQLPEEFLRRVAREHGELDKLNFDPLVELHRIAPSIKIEMRYATLNNCAHKEMYPRQVKEVCFLRKSVAERLKTIQSKLNALGYGLKIWDAYRPHRVQWRFVDPRIIAQERVRNLFAHPRKGSNHARGCAVDATLIDFKTGKECAMPTDFDSALPAALSNATQGLTKEQLANREILCDAMRKENFFTIPPEWWHFNYRADGKEERSRNASDMYLVIDIPFEIILDSRKQ